MKIRKFLSLLLIAVFLLTMAMPIAATEPEVTPEEAPVEPIPAPAEPDEMQVGFTVQQFANPMDIFKFEPAAAMLIELNSGVTLFQLDPDERNFPASTTKIMTCLLALEHGNLQDVLTVSATALEGLHESGSTADLLEGEQMTLENLLYCTMVASANEACNVIAEYISGSVENFVALMNQRAQELGCTNTHYVNPHGLHDEDHYSSARDVALITLEALKHDEFVKITNTVQRIVPATNLSAERKLDTTNLLLQDTSTGYYYSKASGIKTGFTTPAQCCLVSTADDGNIRLLSIMLGAPLVQDENENWIKRNFPDTINLFEYGFNSFHTSTVMSTLYPVAEVQVNQSAGAQTVALAPTQEVRCLIDQDYDPDEIILDIDIPNTTVDAPVEAGAVLGHVTVSYHGMILGHSDLAAITSIARSEITHRADETKAYVEHNWWKWLVGILVLFIVVMVGYIIFLYFYRKQMRRRKVAARRRALEMQRRRQQLRDFFPDN